MSTGHSRVAVLARWLPAVAWMAVIFTLSSIGGLRVSDDVDVDRPIRAVAHMATYALLAALLLYALVGRSRPTWRGVGLAFVLSIVYAVSDEIHQAFVPGRNGRLEDVVIDTVGAIVGLTVAGLVLRRWSAARGHREVDSAG